MDNKLQNNINKLMVVASILILILIIALFNLTILQGENQEQRSLSRRTRTLQLSAERGTIYDVNGLPLAYDRLSYDVTFHRDPINSGERWRALYSETIIDAIDIIEQNGNTISTLDGFVIKRDGEGELYFDWGTGSLETLQARDKLWRSNMSILETDTAQQAYVKLRQRYMLPDELTFTQAAKVLSVWQEVQNYAFKSYIPITIAKDVDTTTVAQINEKSSSLYGMDIHQGYTRVYPRGESAAHIVGYMGKEYSADKLAQMSLLGYNTEDIVGIYGIEATMEARLSSLIGSRVGKKVIEVDNRGREIRVLEYVEPKRGDDVYLTVDIELQNKLEEALAANIDYTAEQQRKEYEKDPEKYAKKEQERGGRQTRFAETGGAVVMDVRTGNVLALASYPSFDPNLFVGGISAADYDILNDERTSPLFNKAVSSRAEPGSIFKMITGMAGLMEGAITLEEPITCEYEYRAHVTQGRAPKCHTTNVATHANQNMIAGLKNSCNYYFYTIADRLGNEDIANWAGNFGLTSRTGIQLSSEVTGYVANKTVLYDPTKLIETESGATEQKTYKPKLVKNSVKQQLKQYGVTRAESYSEESLERAAIRIVQLVGESGELGPGIRTIMREELGIPESITYAYGWQAQIASILYELTWTPNQRIMSGIGQGVTAVTPIAVARYISAIANFGTVYNANIVNRVMDNNGNVLEENDASVFGTIEGRRTKEYFDAIQEGMREVVSPEDRGTGAEIFRDFKYSDKIAAKTGTAQVSDIDLENTSWFVCYTPIVVEGSDERPEIAIVVYIPNGYKGSLAGRTARDVIEFYLDRQEMQVTEQIESPGNLTR